MEKTKKRIYHIDGDTLEAVSRYNEQFNLWIEDYIDFEGNPRRTPTGRLWKSVTTTDCPYSHPIYKDCGTCRHLRKERPEDLIGVCMNDRLRVVSDSVSVKVIHEDIQNIEAAILEQLNITASNA